MGNILHLNAKTTIRVRKEIHESKESILKLAKKYSTQSFRFSSKNNS